MLAKEIMITLFNVDLNQAV